MLKSSPKYPIFIVDDERQLLDSLSMTLFSAGYEHAVTFSDGQAVLDLLPDPDCSLVLLDLFMPTGVSGEEILKRFSMECPHIPVVVITGVDETKTAVRCMHAGAFDYLVKPVEADLLIATVRRACSHSLLLRQNAVLRDKLLQGSLDQPEAFAHVITNNQQMQSIFRYLEVVAPASDPVLITGETGTGKDLLAAALHGVSGRTGPFLSMNVAGLDDNMFSDALFGHLKGAFTDAGTARQGLVSQAEDGTLLLDEIGDLSMASQLKLLKLIQDREYYPLGAERPRRSKARIVAATNRDLAAAMRQGRFRKDLYYRINTYHVHLPPLRERTEDIPLLAEHFLGEACVEMNMRAEHVTSRIATILQSHDYPGNIRELRTMIFTAMAHGGLDHLKQSPAGRGKVSATHSLPSSKKKRIQYPDPLPTLNDAVRELLREALRRTRGNQSAAARMLGVSRQAMHQRTKGL